MRASVRPHCLSGWTFFCSAVRASGAAGLLSACSGCSAPARHHITPRACGDTVKHVSIRLLVSPPVRGRLRGCQHGAERVGGLFGCFRCFERGRKQRTAALRRPLFKARRAATIAQPPPLLLPRLNVRRSGGEPQTEGRIRQGN